MLIDQRRWLNGMMKSVGLLEKENNNNNKKRKEATT